MPAATKSTRATAAATRWLSRPWASRKRRPSGVSGTSPSPDLVRDEDRRNAQHPERGDEPLGRPLGVATRQHQVREPERQAVDDDGVGRPERGERRGELERRLDRAPAFAALGPVPGDALGHLGVAGLAGRDIDAPRPERGGAGKRVAGLSRPRAAEDQPMLGRVHAGHFAPALGTSGLIASGTIPPAGFGRRRSRPRTPLRGAAAIPRPPGAPAPGLESDGPGGTPLALRAGAPGDGPAGCPLDSRLLGPGLAGRGPLRSHPSSIAKCHTFIPPVSGRGPGEDAQRCAGSRAPATRPRWPANRRIPSSSQPMTLLPIHARPQAAPSPLSSQRTCSRRQRDVERLQAVVELDQPARADQRHHRERLRQAIGERDVDRALAEPLARARSPGRGGRSCSPSTRPGPARRCRACRARPPSVKKPRPWLDQAKFATCRSVSHAFQASSEAATQPAQIGSIISASEKLLESAVGRALPVRSA